VNRARAPQPASRWRLACVGLTLAILAAGCTSTTVRSVDMTPPEQASEVIPEALLLDVGVAVFDANVPEDFDVQVEQNVSPEVRRAEGNYIAYFLKNLLQTTGQWGAVRVVPRETFAVDLIVSGRILHSDGERLAVEASVTDASGVKWFTRKYEALASRYAYDASVPRDIDPFQSIYRAIADDMLEHRKAMSEADVTRIRTVAEMKFARDFAPDAFSGYVQRDRRGVEQIERLPAESDPMLARVRRVREREYLFIDTLDEYFAGFHRSMFTPYQDWRRATFDEALAYRELKAQSKARMVAGAVAIAAGVAGTFGSDEPVVQAAGIAGIAGGALTIRSAIDKAAEAKIHAEVLQELGVSAEAEITPHTIELENQTVRLSGTVDAQYDELRGILRRIYYEELGLALPAEPASADATAAKISDS
jgi:hypothetical protein